MKRRLSDKDMLKGALGGWIYRDEPRLVTEPQHSVDGAVTFIIKVHIPAEAANKAREEYANKAGGWNRSTK